MTSVALDPLVSVIIPAYNASALTVKTVESVLAQTFKNIEIIVVDDGSMDDTQARMEAFGEKIIYIRQENAGACSARNVGIKRSKGKYIGLLDCDDIYTSMKIEKCVRLLEAQPDIGLVHTNAHYINVEGEIIGQGKGNRASYQGMIKEKLIVVDLIFNPTVVIRRECFDRVGLFDESLFPPADWEMWLRISEKYPIAYIDEPLSGYRIASNWNFRSLDRVEKEELIVLEKFFQRNPDVSKRIKDKAYSRYHFTLAKCLLVKKDDERMKHHLMLALSLDPLNIKANVMFIYYLIAKENLRKFAARSIFVEI